MIVRSTEKHKPGKKVKVKERYYHELLAHVGDLEAEIEFYRELFKEMTQRSNMPENLIERMEAQWQEFHSR